MAMLKGAEIVIECLKEQGVDTVFGYPGGAILNIYDALYKNSDTIRHILTAHEQATGQALQHLLNGTVVHAHLHGFGTEHGVRDLGFQ